MLLRRRDPAHFVSYLVMPMVLMLIFKGMLGEPHAGGHRPAGDVLGAVDGRRRHRHPHGTHLAHLGPPARHRATVPEIMIGKAVPVFAVLVVQQAVLLVYGVLAVGMRLSGPVWPLALAVTAWSFALLCVGTAIAGVVRSQGELSTLCNIAALSVSALGGALVPYALMPAWAQGGSRRSRPGTGRRHAAGWRSGATSPVRRARLRCSGARASAWPRGGVRLPAG
ncbi:hypothetical protein GCM10020220_109420 [Nonomuraea rubra]|uniref:ABC transporter permease n=1 Tax=Nonomuraea rubra TaxID=46180 RepID=UPI0031F199AA